MRLLLLLCLVPSLWASTIDKQHPFTKTAIPFDVVDENEKSSEFWQNKAQNWLASKINGHRWVKNQASTARNIIIFLGDGMSVHTLTASRAMLGDSTEQLSFDKFPYTGFSRTYCVDRQVTDSASSATAYLGGVKANYGTIGVNANVLRGDCESGTNPDYFVESIAKWAQDAKKSAGLVTTARVTHASPSGVYAHTADRNWENNAEVLGSGCDDSKVQDIARQLVENEVGKNLRVIMGGGRQNFRDSSVNDEEGLSNKRTDGRDLIDEWLSEKQASGAKAHYVWSRKGLSLVDLNNTDYLMGLFCNSHCPYNGDITRERTQGVYPTLTEMTEAAIQVLSRNEEGFFLFVEGARIDMAHHDTLAYKSLEDTIEFSNAVQRAVDLTSRDDTLIVVTSDHSHTMTVNGYPRRGKHITGLSDSVTANGIPHAILSYANGPGYVAPTATGTARLNAAAVENFDTANQAHPASVPLGSETHGGDDVGVFALGPYAQYFSGNYEQTNIPAMMARAARIGPYADIN